MKTCDSCPSEIPDKLNKEGKISNMNQTTCDSCLIINANKAPSTAAEPKEKKMTQAELFKSYLQDEQLYIDSLDWDNNPQESREILAARISEYEKIAFEVKARAVRGFSKLRELEARDGETYTLSSVEKTKQAFAKKSKDKQKKLSKLEGIVKNLILTGNTDEEIMDFIPVNMGSPSEIKLLIEKMKELIKEEE